MSEENSGLMGSIRQLLSTLISIVTTRVELLGNELQEERLRLLQMLTFALLALSCFGLAILLLTIFVVVLFWDEHRLAAIGALSFLFFTLGLLMAMLLRGKMREKSKLFAATLAELAKDSEQIGGKDE